MYSVFDIAYWFLQNVDRVSSKKLQKLTYYAYAWYILMNNETADNIENRFFYGRYEAWIHGAVCPELYNKYKSFGPSDIPKYTGEVKDFSEDDLDLLNQIIEVYGKYSGNQLESICHQEDPWIKARGSLSAYESCQNVFSDTDIYKYYSARVNG